MTRRPQMRLSGEEYGILRMTSRDDVIFHMNKNECHSSLIDIYVRYLCICNYNLLKDWFYAALKPKKISENKI